MRTAASWLLLFAVALSGCASLRADRPELPARNAVRLDQLVIHSNFELPKHHRLLEEVQALRWDIVSKLDLTPSDEPIHVYLFENDEQFKAYVHSKFPSFPDRRAFFVETETQLSVYAQWGEHVAVDLRHEVTHGYLHSMVQNLPLWLDEGLAEYFEVPRGTHGYHRVNIDDLTANLQAGRWRPDIHRLEALKSVAEMGRTEYAESWAWVHLLLETEPARRDLLRGYLASLRREAASEPLSYRLHQANLDNPALLLAHLQTLSAATVAEPSPPPRRRLLFRE
ncbi:MAG TPA: DUF1570 domain-containing protein [Pirellulales bacterium]|jgi:hypothetical protein|nr:DUF1570 domain-containing protein [Pirellulales bacterium]